MDVRAPELGGITYNVIERTYISAKVSTVRWKPELGVPNYFVTGTYEEDDNYLGLWSYPSNWEWNQIEETDTAKIFGEKIPTTLQKISVAGDVSAIKFVENNKFLYSTEGGEFGVVNIDSNEHQGKLGMNRIHNWDCEFFGETSISYRAFEVGSAFICALGEDGHLYFLSQDLNSSLGTINHYNDEASCLGILSANEVLVGNLRGQISLWDLREGLFEPAKIFPYNSEETIGLTCITPFPRQRQIVVTGGTDGAVVTWDLRTGHHPLTVYKAHDHPITCLQFHEDWPANMFTASMGGEVWHWNNFGKLLTGELLDPRLMALPPELRNTMKTQSYLEPQIRALIGKKHIPTNSLDVIKEQLVCSTDNDALVFVKPLKIN